jgi:predicted DNA-binding transcriptional regulator AlpA
MANTATPANNHDQFVPDAQVARELGITLMTLWRYDHDESLNFPPPIKIRNKNYRSRLALEAWKQDMLKRALEQRADRPPRKRKSEAA